MKLKHYELICLLVTVILGFEYAILNHFIGGESVVIKNVYTLFKTKNINLSPVAGYPISYFLGWLGFFFILLTNPYLLKKRVQFLKKLGSLKGWLEFHIFCGMIGPIFIVFHTNFKINGLVAISFWSMIIASTSGIVGRYFYIQTLKVKEDLKKSLLNIEFEFKLQHNKKFNEVEFQTIFQYAKNFAAPKNEITNPLMALLSSVQSDVTLMFVNPGEKFGIIKREAKKLKQLAIINRRVLLIQPFQKLLGYWHAFHLPFAIFMYIVAIIHIITALLFGVKH